jgi:L-lactate dehydrogenase complex protein LldE
VLERAGCDVHVPEGQTCCGQPAFNGGFTDEARVMARYTVDLLARDESAVVVPSGSCADMLIHHAPELLAHDHEAAARAERVAARTYEFTQFLVDVLGQTSCGACLHASATYHPSCHGLRGLGVRRQPRILLEHVEGLELKPLDDAETCCGFGGLFAVKMSEISGAMLERKLANIEASGADLLVGTDVSCLMHLAGGLHRRGGNMQVRHVAEVLAQFSSAGEPVDPV